MNKPNLAKISPLVAFFLLLVFKVALTRWVIYGEVSWTKLITVDIPSLLVPLSLIAWLVRKRKFWAFFAVDAIVTSILFSAIMYYQYFGVIVTYRALHQANQVTQVQSSVISLMHPYFMLVFVDLAVFLLAWLFYRPFRGWTGRQIAYRKRESGFAFTAFLAISILNGVFNQSIVNEIRRADEMGLLNYEVSEIGRGLTEKAAKPETVTVQTVNETKGIMASANPLFFGAAKGRNVIVVQMEAMQNMLLNLKVNGTEITPVLNSLLGQSYYFPHIFQQVGSGNTSDAEFMLNTSLYVPKDGPASQVYAKKSLPSLPKLLKEQGYTTLTFHTDNVNFWNRKDLYPALGFDKFYDDRTFGHSDMVMMGSSDEVLYKKTVDILKTYKDKQQTFYADIITLSGHHPFTIPKSKQRIELPSEYKGTLLGNYLTAQNYADFALGQLVDELKAANLWDNSMLLIYGDHMGLPIYALSESEKDQIERLTGKPYNYDSMMNIPLLTIIPGVTDGQRMESIGGQIDFMPTIANLVGVPMGDRILFGQDLLNQPHNLLAERYYLPTGSFIDDNEIFIPGDSVADGSVVRLEEAVPASQTDSDPTKLTDEYERGLKLLRMSDSYVEHLPNR
jgi:lipoteichoic acid synthase